MGTAPNRRRPTVEEEYQSEDIDYQEVDIEDLEFDELAPEELVSLLHQIGE